MHMWCDFFIIVGLLWDKNKSKTAHIRQFFLLIYEWQQFPILSLYILIPISPGTHGIYLREFPIFIFCAWIFSFPKLVTFVKINLLGPAGSESVNLVYLCTKNQVFN